MSPRTGARRRLGSISLSLILLALVPAVTLTVMWGVTTIQMFAEGLRLRSQTELSRSTGTMGTEATLAVQQERRLTAVWLVSPEDSRAALEAQRDKTDKAVAQLAEQSDAIAEAPDRVSGPLQSVLTSLETLEHYRDQVDAPSEITAEQALEQYASIVQDQIHAFRELSQVDDGDLTSQASPLVAMEQAAEMLSRENALLTLVWPSGELDQESWAEFTQLVTNQRWLIEDQVLPSLSGDTKTQIEEVLGSPEWQSLQSAEDSVRGSRPTAEDTKSDLPDVREQWGAALEKVIPQYTALIEQEAEGLLDRSSDKARELLLTAAFLSTGGLLALSLCVGMSWRITRSLSRRLTGLREATLSLAEERLPETVARLERGEKVDAESATPPLEYGHDELGEVAKAFNTAQRTAVHTAIELADIRTGFQKVILGIARQSQNLVNLQLSKLDLLERTHTDPEVLRGLYELDSVASQLRRYEENLVIVSGERPGRSWSEPVALIDILRSAVGEVAEYQRVDVHTDEEVALAPPAVADVIHLLAELIDNATTYSPSPSLVGVRAAMVAKGLAVEVEDRGLGLSEEDYASINTQLASPPQFDVVALADDLRLGMFVVSQLAHRHGITVTLRTSPYGGTTAIVLVPYTIVVQGTTPAPQGAASAVAGAVNGRPPASARSAVNGTAVPAALGARATSDTDTPEVPEVPEIPEIPAAWETPEDWETQEDWNIPDTPEDWDTPEVWNTPTTWNIPETWDTPDRQTSWGRPALPSPSGSPAPVTAHPAEAAPAPRPKKLTPLPRRVPQTSLTAELREETAPLTVEDNAVNFTAEHAASSLSGFQRGTFEARDDETDSVRTATHGDNTASPGYPPSAEGSRHRPPNAER